MSQYDNIKLHLTVMECAIKDLRTALLSQLNHTEVQLQILQGETQGLYGEIAQLKALPVFKLANLVLPSKAET